VVESQGIANLIAVFGKPFHFAFNELAGTQFSQVMLKQ
jgi:hypothetical protein